MNPPAIPLPLARGAHRLVEHDLFIIGLATPLLLAPNLFAPGLVAVVLFLVAALWVTARGRRDIVPNPLNLPLLLLLLTVFPSLYASADWQQSLPKLNGIIAGVMLCTAIAAYCARDWRRAIRLIQLFGTGGIALTIVMLLCTNWGDKFGSFAPLYSVLQGAQEYGGLRLDINPNQAAGMLVQVLPVLVALVIVARGNQRLGWTFGLVLTAITLLLTQSRSALWGLALAGIAWLLYQRPRLRVWFALGLVSAVLLLFLIPPLQAIALNVFQREWDALTAAQTPRVEIWERALYMLRDFPLTGVGLNMFSRIAPTFYPYFTISPDVNLVHAHNQILQVGIDFGLPGMAANIALLVVFFISMARTISRAQDARIRVLAAGLLFAVVAQQGFGLFDALPLGSRTGFFFWLLLGLGTGLEVEASTAQGSLVRSDVIQALAVWLLGSLLSVIVVVQSPYYGILLAVLTGVGSGAASVLVLDRLPHAASTSEG